MTERPDYTGEPGPTGPTGADGPTGPAGPPGTTTWDGITDKPTTFAPEAHKTGHQDGGADEIDATGLAGRVNYVNRGDPSVDDWILASLTDDNAWHELDCSAIVPSGSVAIHIKMLLVATLSNKDIWITKNGAANTANSLHGTTIISNIPCPVEGIVACDADRKLQYKMEDASWGATGITIRGWFI